jgi:hypothetical protein
MRHRSAREVCEPLMERLAAAPLDGVQRAEGCLFFGAALTGLGKGRPPGRLSCGKRVSAAFRAGSEPRGRSGEPAAVRARRALGERRYGPSRKSSATPLQPGRGAGRCSNERGGTPRRTEEPTPLKPPRLDNVPLSHVRLLAKESFRPPSLDDLALVYSRSGAVIPRHSPVAPL